MKMTANFAVPTINLAGYRKELHDYMTKVIIQATREWLQAATGRVPVWSGASRATFSKLASEVKFDIEINPVAMSRVGMGSAASEGSIEAKDSKYVFHYKTTLPWLVWNDAHNANVDPDPTLFAKLINPGPYDLELAGYEAFKAFADTVTLPSVRPFLTSHLIRV